MLQEAEALGLQLPSLPRLQVSLGRQCRRRRACWNPPMGTRRPAGACCVGSVSSTQACT